MSASPADRARELLEAATPGPWYVIEHDDGDDGVSACVMSQHVAITDRWEGRTGELSPENAALIAAAPQLLADLLAEVGRLERERDGLRERERELEAELDDSESEAGELFDELEALAEKWQREQAEYPLEDPRAEPAAAAVRCCARELLAALKKGPADV